MPVLARFTITVSILVALVGCITDELVVYKDSVVGKEAAKPYLGVYHVEEWPGDMKPEKVRVAEKDGELHFSYSVPDKNYDVRFVLSKIPNSKKDLHLLSLPGQGATNQANMFFLGKATQNETRIWAVFANLPVAKDHLTFQNGKFKAKDVKAFLSKHADAFVMANEPQVRLKNPKD